MGRGVARCSTSRCWCGCFPRERNGRRVDGGSWSLLARAWPAGWGCSSRTLARARTVERSWTRRARGTCCLRRGGSRTVRSCRSFTVRRTRPRASSPSRASTPPAPRGAHLYVCVGREQRPSPALPARHPPRPGVESRSRRAAHGEVDRIGSKTFLECSWPTRKRRAS